MIISYIINETLLGFVGPFWDNEIFMSSFAPDPDHHLAGHKSVTLTDCH